MSAIKLAATALGVAVTLSRHPVVRAGVRAAAPVVLNPRNRERAMEATLSAAYNAGVLARRIRGLGTGRD
ncbi:MAG TPA: hypothetical protein VGM83_20325 [Devosiaceae bacterium]|jgi:hypothetical protein